MWIPHTIPALTLHLFNPPASTVDIGSLPNGVIKSDDFSWDNRSPAPLKLLCLDVMAVSYTRHLGKLLEQITPLNAVYFVEILNTSLPIPLVIGVPDGEYWRRRFDDTWPNFVQTSWDTLATDSYKTYYLTKYVSEIIENLVPGYVDEDELAALLVACSPHVTAVDCKQLCVTGTPLRESQAPEESGGTAVSPDPAHVNLELVLNRLKRVRRVGLVYGPRTAATDVGHARDPDPYKFNIEDMDTLGRGLVSSRYLTSLAVTKSDMDAIKFGRLSQYLAECRCLEDVDFSFCGLRSPGAESISLYAKTAKHLKLLNLRGNGIGPDGVKPLVVVLMKRRKTGLPAIELNLNMNDIGDAGAKYLAAALASGVQPFTTLRLRNCNITEIGGVNIVRSLEHDRGLRAMEIDNNPLTLDVAIALHAVLKNNFNIAYLSTQNCDFPEKMAVFFNAVAYYNRRDKRPEFDYADITDLYDNDDEGDYSLQEEGVCEEQKSEIDEEP